MPDENDVVYDTYGFDLISVIKALFHELTATFTEGGGFNGFIETLSFWWNVYSLIALLLSALFIAGFIYARIRYAQLAAIQQEELKQEELYYKQIYEDASKGNPRWAEIERHIGTDNPSDWRLAIIEADVLLDEVLRDAGYVGDTIGDKLKTANPTAFTTLDDAWEAHKVRNEVAHAGSDFVLTKKIASETVTRYERVFREFRIL